MSFNIESFSEGPDEYLEAITKRTNEILPRHTMGEEVLADVYLLRDLLRDSADGHFPSLPFRVWMRIVHALDYFIEVNDRIADGRNDGLTDDLLELHKVRQEFGSIIKAYIRWRNGRQHL